MFKPFLAVFRREFLRIFKHRHLRLVCLVSPFVYGVVLSSVYVHKRINEVPLGLVDMDNSALSRQAARWLDATENADIKRSYPTEREALDALIRGEVHGFLYIPEDFSRDIKRGREARLRVAADYSNVVVANPVLMAASDMAGELSAQEFSGLAARRGIVRRRIEDLNQLVRYDVRPIFNPQMNYSDFFIPGLIFVVLQQIMMVGLAFTVAEEREGRRGRELYELAGGKLWPLLLGKAVPHAIVNYCISLLFIFLLLPHFNLVFRAGFPAALLFTAAFTLATASFGLLVSSCFRTTVNAFLALMFFSMPAFLISGISWPAYSLPWFVRAVAAPIPSTHFIVWFRMALGAPGGGVPLAGPTALLLAMTAVYLGIGWLVLRRMYRAGEARGSVSIS